MKYLFFDIECSNCFNKIGKICEFGYVLTDENFKIINKSEFVINPGKGRGSRFHLKGRKHQKDLELAYDYSYYYSQPEFPSFYSKIKTLMEAEDTICFAWSSDNDILYLNNTCVRYKKDPLNYVCYDVQKIAQRYLGETKQIHLRDTCIKLFGANEIIDIQEHLSSDDSLMTMMILRYICKMNNVLSVNFINDADYAKEISKEFVKKIREKESLKKEIKRRHDFYREICIDNDCVEELNKNKGKRYNLSGNVKKNVSDLTRLTGKIQNNGGVFVDSIYCTDIFICYDNEDLNNLENRFNNIQNIKFITVDDLNKGGKV